MFLLCMLTGLNNAELKCKRENLKRNKNLDMNLSSSKCQVEVASLHKNCEYIQGFTYPLGWIKECHLTILNVVHSKWGLIICPWYTYMASEEHVEIGYD